MVLVLDETAKERIKEIKQYAENNPYSMDDLLDIKNGAQEPPGNNAFFSCYIPQGFSVVYTMELYKEKQSLNNSGEKNKMFGKPSPKGSGNGWSGWYKDWYFRSIHELSFMINYIERFNFNWKSAESKFFQIEYIDHEGKKRNYFPDFVINDKYLIECKPKKLQNSINVLAKKDAAKLFCLSNKLIYKIIDPHLISLEKIKELYLSKSIVFLEKYEKKFVEKYLK